MSIAVVLVSGNVARCCCFFPLSILGRWGIDAGCWGGRQGQAIRLAVNCGTPLGQDVEAHVPGLRKGKEW